ncbi:hypothetical protein ACI2KS_10585 [Pseudomonas sp. NPDC087358]|uniref:hypothetical protein n=1 Tax=Pseudomonas sp. NPDC087358 TaxID=3364439 RepID=UPI00384B7C7B
METSSPRQAVQTRDQVLIAHAQNQIARTSMSQDDFAQALCRQLHSSCAGKAIAKDVPDLDALNQTNDVSAFLKATGRWLKRVQRWLAAESDLPTWLEEAWVDALDPEYRDHCINELASRHGLIGARHLGNDVCANRSFGALIRALGDVIDTGSEVFDDQVMCEQDLPHLPAFAEQCRQVEARAGELGRKAEQLMSSSRLRAVS